MATPATKPVPVVAPKADLSRLSPERWPEIARELGLAGLSRQFAQQSTFEGREGEAGDRLRFCVPLEALAETSLIERVEASLAAYFGQKVRVSVRIGAPQGPTAAAQDARMKAEALAQAEASITQSPVVQDLIRAFDAKIVPGSIRSVGPLPTDALAAKRPAQQTEVPSTSPPPLGESS
jgi:DNA polymerase-3 subunit gamma/tau